MEWINNRSLSKDEYDLINQETRDICKRYKVKLPDIMCINKRYRSTDGTFIIYQDGENKDNMFITEIGLAYKHLKQFGIDSLIKVLYHELAHYIRYKKYDDFEHSEKFKELCYELGGHLDEQYHSKKKYNCLKYEGIEAPDQWEYNCICGEKLRAKRKLKMDARYCSICKYPLSFWRVKKIKK